MGKVKKATWIWYPGEFEIWQHMKISFRRRERFSTFPPFWKLDNFYPGIVFRKEVYLDKTESIKVYVDGDFHISLDNNRLRYAKGIIEVPAGKHTLNIVVSNQHTIPSIFVQGETIISDDSWEATCYDGVWHKVGHWNLDCETSPPSEFKLPVTEVLPVQIEKLGSSYFIDFGKEIYASLKLTEVSGTGNINISYGESREEALAIDQCAQIDLCEAVEINNAYTFSLKAFRYVNIVCEGNVNLHKFSALFEYLPLNYRGSFKCSDEKLNSIWEVSRYTLHLNTREFFLDGIKRDGWVWSGDAYQSFLMNYYAFFDNEVCKRTLTALRGKDPVATHINTIMDYSFYWFVSFYDYYLYTGDLEFIKQNYSKMLTLMDFCIKRTNKNGMMEGLKGDWVFIDWADMDNKGEVSAEQLLFYRSLEIMGQISQLLADDKNFIRFSSLAKELKNKIVEFFWNEDLGGLVITRINDKPLEQITKHANIFALMFNLLDKNQVSSVVNKVLLNESIQKIKTPYFRFYELAALCEAGKHAFVIKEILDYWGCMLNLGATTFWEEYDPTLKGTEHYAMYGEPFDKSLCHAWGASPIYLLGKYFLGVTPLTPGYEIYEIKPNLGSLSWIQGVVPTPNGDINVYMDKSVIKVSSSSNKGYLRFYSNIKPEAWQVVQQTGTTNMETSLVELTSIDENLFELVIDKPNQEYVVKYEN